MTFTPLFLPFPPRNTINSFVPCKTSKGQRGQREQRGVRGQSKQRMPEPSLKFGLPLCSPLLPSVTLLPFAPLAPTSRLVFSFEIRFVQTEKVGVRSYNWLYLYFAGKLEVWTVAREIGRTAHLQRHGRQPVDSNFHYIFDLAKE